jgi:ankyrin repeat protein
MWASGRGHAATVRVLLENGANVNAISTNGGNYTALSYACAYGNFEVACLLSAYGADFSIVDTKGKRPAHEAMGASALLHTALQTLMQQQHATLQTEMAAIRQENAAIRQENAVLREMLQTWMQQQNEARQEDVAARQAATDAYR